MLLVQMGANDAITPELLDYCSTQFKRPAESHPHESLVLPDEPHVADWQRYADAAQAIRKSHCQ